MLQIITLKSIENVLPLIHKMQHLKGIIFDMDDTLVPENLGIMSDEIKYLLKSLSKNGYQLAILTNNFNTHYCQQILSQVYPLSINVIFIESAFKPFVNSFNLIKNQFSLLDTEIAVIGDGIITDALGAKLCNMSFFKAAWYRHAFYKRGVLFYFRETIVIIYDCFRYHLLGHRPKVTLISPMEFCST